MVTSRRGHGEGSVYQRHDHETCPPATDGERPKHACQGRWVSTIDYGWENGKRRRRVLYGRTKREVLDKLRDAQRKGERTHRTRHTVETWLDEWINEIHGRRLKDSTARGYRSKISQYLVPLLGKHRLDALEPRHVRRAYQRLTEPCPSPVDGMCPHAPSHGLSDANVRQAHVILKRALTDAIRDDLIDDNPAEKVDPPSTKKNQRARLTSAQAELVLKVAADLPDASRWFVALRMGLRQGEALGLPWGLVDLERGMLTVARTLEHGKGKPFGTPKSEASNRTIAIEPTTLAHLKVHHARYVAEHGAPPPADLCVWTQADGTPIGHKTDWSAWRSLLAKAGMPAVSPHSARATCASWLEENGWPARLVAEYLGHTKVETTYIYQRGAGVERQAAAFSAGAPAVDAGTPALPDAESPTAS